MKFFSNTTKGVSAKRAFKHWIPLCEAWAVNIERYTRLTDKGNAAYNNNERANIGLLAGAAWSSGNIALEEFSSTKSVPGNEKHGRIDLWLGFENKKEEYIEAKFKKMSIRGDYFQQTRSTLDAALKDAKDTQGGEDITATGLVFLVFYMKQCGVDEALASLDEAVSSIHKELKPDILSWCFPERDIKHTDEDGYIVPGVIMLGQRYSNPTKVSPSS